MSSATRWLRSRASDGKRNLANWLAHAERGAGGNLALSFDDGPEPRTTPKVLDLLAEANVSATFFLVGRRAEQHPHLVGRILAAGHAIGSHTYSHRPLFELGPREVWQECQGGRAAVEHVAGQEVRLFRPPHGFLGPWSALAVQCLALETWLWTCDGADWRVDATSDSILSRLGHPTAGDIVLLHDGLEPPCEPAGAREEAMLAALAALLLEIQSCGVPVGPLPCRRRPSRRAAITRS